MRQLQIILVVLIFSFSVAACTKSAARTNGYVWENVTAKAAFPQGYNYPVFVLNGKMLALNDGGWLSADGKNWAKTELAESGLNPAYLKYVKLGDAVYALGAIEGNYLDFKLSSRILRTRDGKSWETLAEKSNLPHRIFYGVAAFKDKIWLVGGYDGKRYYNDVWNSADGVTWTRVAEKAAWSERNAGIFVFKNRLWLIGGGVIDGEKTNNPNSGREVWTSEDGIEWKQEKINAPLSLGGTPIVFDDKLWLIGANRHNGDFGSAVFVSDDGLDWRELSAPWTPRGGTVVWVFGDKLFMTGGKFSYREPHGEIKFVYSSDVWTMRKPIKN